MDVLRFQYVVIQLNRLDWRRYSRKRNPVAAAFMAKMMMAKHDRPRVKLKCMTMLAALALDRKKSQLLSAFVDAYLPLNQEEIEQFDLSLKSLSKPVREEVMELTTSWMRDGIKIGRKEGLEQGLQQGLQQGKAEGKAEGRHQEAFSIALRVLIRRLGRLNATMSRSVEQLSVEQLEELILDSDQLNGVRDLKNWLKSRKSEI